MSRALACKILFDREEIFLAAFSKIPFLMEVEAVAKEELALFADLQIFSISDLMFFLFRIMLFLLAP
jgi:hypothetical protein|tara:strand:- start:1946 stop:2146 length:201 start_codon:yes stop_codon:yes gene_type:complete